MTRDSTQDAHGATPPLANPWLADPLANRGTAFSEAQRERLGLAGLLPPRVESIAEQAARVLANLRAKPNPLEKYLYLAALQNDNETLFYRVVLDHLEETLPLVYTPTVGQACLEWSRIYARPRGLYVSARHRGRMRALLENWPRRGVRMIVATDGGRILGLGDLGANGMGIPIGKLALYSACAGVHPAHCLPVALDLGCDVASVRDDPFYVGLRAPRLPGAEYDEAIEEFVQAVQAVFPEAILQFEDFANVNAFRLLARYRPRLCSFNDDIQGTGAMGLAGLYAAGRIEGVPPLANQRILFVGAGEANIGIGSLVVSALCAEGLPRQEALRRCWFMDSRGLVVAGRASLAEHKLPFAHAAEPAADLPSAIERIRPTALIGASGQGGLFTRPVLEAMARLNRRPLVFALSNPTSKAECSAEQAYGHTAGRAVFASGSPFPPFEFEGRTLVSGQGNNCFVFPGVGLGLLVSGATRVPDAVFLAAARALAAAVRDQELAQGRVFPAQDRMREIAAALAQAVAEVVQAEGLASEPKAADPAARIRDFMYRPEYA